MTGAIGWGVVAVLVVVAVRSLLRQQQRRRAVVGTWVPGARDVPVNLAPKGGWLR